MCHRKPHEQCFSLKNMLNTIELVPQVLQYNHLRELYCVGANTVFRTCVDPQLQDLQYLTEKVWSSQSALSACKDLGDLAMVRWDKSVPWSPWNCILLTKDEAAAHLKLASAEEVGGPGSFSAGGGPWRHHCNC